MNNLVSMAFDSEKNNIIYITKHNRSILQQQGFNAFVLRTINILVNNFLQ